MDSIYRRRHWSHTALPSSSVVYCTAHSSPPAPAARPPAAAGPNPAAAGLFSAAAAAAGSSAGRFSAGRPSRASRFRCARPAGYVRWVYNRPRAARGEGWRGAWGAEARRSLT